MDLPYVTAEYPGIGGEIKADPSHFQVTEIPLYDPCGEGEHLYFNITKENLTTHEMVTILAKLFDVSTKDIGFAGMKDKLAITTQTVSIALGRNYSLEQAEELIVSQLPMLKLNWAKRHNNKLKTGHLKGNLFKILLTDYAPQGNYRQIAEKIKSTGMANFYGEQRFGAKGDNARKGKELFFKKRSLPHHKRKLLLSSYQSQLFNIWLSQRITDGLFDQVIAGDLLDRDKLVTGPMFGFSMPCPTELAQEREVAILENEQLTLEEFKKVKLKGTRRASKALLQELEITEAPEGLWFNFKLPPGSYATILLREFIKPCH